MVKSGAVSPTLNAGAGRGGGPSFFSPWAQTPARGTESANTPNNRTAVLLSIFTFLRSHGCDFSLYSGRAKVNVISRQNVLTQSKQKQVRGLPSCWQSPA